MSQLKIIIFTALFCLLFCTTELYALGPNELNLEKQGTTFSLDVIVKSLGGAMNGLGKSLDGATNGLGKSLDEAMNGLGKSLDGAMGGLGKSLDGAMNGLGEFREETGEVAGKVAEVAIVAGILYLYIIAEASFYYYDYGYHHGYNHGYHRW